MTIRKVILFSVCMLVALFCCGVQAYAATNMTYPRPGVTLNSPNETFSWTSDNKWFWFMVGSYPGGTDIFRASNVFQNTSVTVDNLPADGSTIYVRLYYWNLWGWKYNDYTYVANSLNRNPLIKMKYPQPGSILDLSNIWFSWYSEFKYFYMTIGSSLGGYDLYNSGNYFTAKFKYINISKTYLNMIYVRLYYWNSGWYFHDYLYHDYNNFDFGCNAPSTAKDKMKISNPSCEQIWDYYNYFDVAAKALAAQSDLISAAMDGSIEAHDMRDYVINIGGSVVGVASGNSVEAVIPDAIITLPQTILNVLNLDDSNAYIFTTGTADIVINLLKGVIAEGLGAVNPATAVAMVSQDVVSIANHLYGAYSLDKLTQQSNNIIVTRFYLEKYYQYGGDNGSVAVEYGLPYNSSMWDTIDAVAKGLGFSNDWWGEEYDVGRILRIVEGFQNEIIPVVTSQRLRELYGNDQLF